MQQQGSLSGITKNNKKEDEEISPAANMTAKIASLEDNSNDMEYWIVIIIAIAGL